MFRCCPGWSQQPGSQGCLSRECPQPPVPPWRLHPQSVSRGLVPLPHTIEHLTAAGETSEPLVQPLYSPETVHTN